MRAIWKGAVSFGLVNVPVRLYSATENHDVQFRQVHREDGGRIKYKRTCSIDGEEVAYDDIAKGYETEDGDMVILTDEDFKDLPSKSSKEINVEKFVPTEQIDPMLLDKSYYLEPDKSATKPYVLLREALEFLEEVGDPATGLPIGSSRLNLMAAVAGETHEYTDMYPGMAKSAREEGFDEVADWFETLAKAERSHANRYTKALNELAD